MIVVVLLIFSVNSAGLLFGVSNFMRLVYFKGVIRLGIGIILFSVVKSLVSGKVFVNS